MRLRSLSAAVLASLLTASVVAWGQSGPGVNNNFAVVWNMVWEASTVKPTYSATMVVTPAASQTYACQLSGSATKTIRARRVLLQGNAAAVQSEQIAIGKFSTAFTGGGTQTTPVAYDSQSAAATGVIEMWTASPTAGTLVGYLLDPIFTWNNATTGVGTPLVVSFGQFGSAVALRGAAQSLVVNMNSQPGSGNTLSCTFEWTEE